MHFAHVRCIHNRPALSWQRRKARYLLVAPLLALGLWFASAGVAQANTIEVDATCTLIDAINSANYDTNVAGCEFGVGDDTVLLETDATYTLTETYTVLGGVNNTGLPPITSTILIRGRGATIQRDLAYACPGGSDPDFRIFYVNETGNLTLNGVTVRNGCAPDGGGAYVITGTLTVQSSSMLSNTAKTGDGGGIYVERGTLAVQGSNVLSNTAKTGDGGGIFGTGSSTVISVSQQSTVAANQASSLGGGLYSDEGGTLEVDGSDILSNTATGGGGGIRSRDGALRLLNSQISFNSALQSGGGVSSDGSTVVISETTVAANTAEGANGGGFFIAGGIVTLLNSEVHSNTARSNGGGIFGTNDANLSIENSDVISNTATNGGGGGIWHGGSALTLLNSHVFSNTAIDGGGIYGAAAVTITQQSEVGSNQASDDGGGIYITDSGAVITISDSSLLYNQVESGTGGALYQDDGESSIAESCIVGNDDTAVFYFGGTAPIAATQNWWGSVDGPSGVQPGHGDSVSANVDVIPFLTAAILGCHTFTWDLALSKRVDPVGTLQPGQSLTYTLHFTNTGNRIAESVMLTDAIPTGVQVTSVTSSTLGAGVMLTQTQGPPDYVWQAGNLFPGSGGMITITAMVSAALSADLTLTNTAVVSAEFDMTSTNNVAQVVQAVTLPRVHFSSASYTADENESTALITVTMDATSSHAAVTVEYESADGSATAGSDYTAVSDILIIPAGATSATFTVAINNDNIVEADETVSLSLSNAAGAVLDTPEQATLTILNDDSATMSLAIANGDQDEGDGGSKAFTFAATLDHAVDGGFELAYATDDGLATTTDNDYKDNDGALNFAGTAAEVKTITVTVTGDTKVEADETFSVSLGSVSGLAAGISAAAISIGGSPQSGTIRNDDSANLTLAIVNADRNETDSGSRAFTFAVTLDEAVQGGLNLAYTTNDGSATTADNDYADNDGALNFSGTAAEIETITVQVQGDTRVEPDETFAVALGAVSGLSAGVSATDISAAGSPQSGTIRNDDSAILTLAAGMADANEGDSGTIDFTFTVTLDSPVVGGFDVAYTTDDGTATTEDGDYVNNDGSLSFDGMAGEAKTIAVQVQGDSQVETDESFAVALGAVSGLSAGISASEVAIVGSPQTAIIRNDDSSPEPTAAISLAVTADATLARVGETITYAYQVTNSGEITLTTVQLTDNRLGLIALSSTALPPAATATGTAPYMVQMGDLPGPLANQATASGTPVAGPVVQDQDLVTVDLVHAAFSFRKTVGIQDIQPECTDLDQETLPLNTVVVYCYEITNTGQVTLTTHTLVDDMLGVLLNNAVVSLAPGASYSTTITHSLTMSVTNVATWTAGYAGSANEDVVGAAIDALPAQGSALALIQVSGMDEDQDGDGIPDNVEGAADPDGDNLSNFRDNDSDGDETPDNVEAGEDPTNPRDSNTDGLPDFLDPNQPGTEEPDVTSIFMPWLSGAASIGAAQFGEDPVIFLPTVGP